MAEAATLPQDSPAAPVSNEGSNSPEPSLNEGAEAFSNQIFTLIGHEDVADITFLQADILERMRDSNLSLSEFNNFATAKYSELSSDFQKHTAMIKDMRKDLDFIFRKIRSLKQRIGDKYPEALAAAALPEEEEEY